MKNIIALSLLAFTSLALAQPPAQEVKGTNLGGKTGTVFVARDKATWDKVKKSLGEPQTLPIAMPKGDDLTALDGVDFKNQMIVVVSWGQMNFSGHGEKCWIEGVLVAKDEVLVDCRATLWGGPVDASYKAWPYHAKVVPRSELPVQFKQTTEWTAPPARSEKDKTLATLKNREWKKEISSKE